MLNRLRFRAHTLKLALLYCIGLQISYDNYSRIQPEGRYC